MKTHKEQSRIQVIDWLLRMMKGMMIGSGAILPGVSGGALAAVFGLYEPLIVFLSDITNDFVKRVMYFLPVGVGGILGVFVLAYPLDYGLQYYPVHVLWAFIGAIIGTLPSLYREAGKHGRTRGHIILALTVAIVMFFILFCLVKQPGLSPYIRFLITQLLLNLKREMHLSSFPFYRRILFSIPLTGQIGRAHV